jgi:hypothetical protein
MLLVKTESKSLTNRADVVGEEGTRSILVNRDDAVGE